LPLFAQLPRRRVLGNSRELRGFRERKEGQSY
jgi:hypothetical protein